MNKFFPQLSLNSAKCCYKLSHVALCCFDVFLYSQCKSVTSGFKKVSDDSRLKRNLVRTTIEMDKELIMQYENGCSDLTTKVVWENLQSLLY